MAIQSQSQPWSSVHIKISYTLAQRAVKLKFGMSNKQGVCLILKNKYNE